MNDNDTIEKLKQEIIERRSRLYELEIAERVKINEKLVGKYYRYENGLGADDRWYGYAAVKHIDDKGFLWGVTFEMRDSVNIDIVLSEPISDFVMQTEITKKEFLAEYDKIVQILSYEREAL